MKAIPRYKKYTGIHRRNGCIRNAHATVLRCFRFSTLVDSVFAPRGFCLIWTLGLKSYSTFCLKIRQLVRRDNSSNNDSIQFQGNAEWASDIQHSKRTIVQRSMNRIYSTLTSRYLAGRNYSFREGLTYPEQNWASVAIKKSPVIHAYKLNRVQLEFSRKICLPYYIVSRALSNSLTDDLPRKETGVDWK